MKASARKRAQGKNLSIEDVARVARVGLGTASRALSGSDHVSESARKRVVRAAERLGYRKNPHARALRGGSVPSAVFLCCNRALTNTFHGAVLEAAVTRLNDLGWQTVLLRWDTPPDPPFPPKILSRVGTDVLIFAGITSAGILDRCRAFGHPMIVSQLGFEPPDQMKGCDKVAVDELEAFKMAVLHLVELGHRRIGIVTDPAFPWSARELAWWETECKRRGLPFVQPPPIRLI